MILWGVLASQSLGRRIAYIMFLCRDYIDLLYYVASTKCNDTEWTALCEDASVLPPFNNLSF